MEQNNMEILETIKQYRFAVLPPRMYRQGDDQDRKKESESGKYSVQCQICGRMGAMSIEDMKKHSERHLEQQKAKEKTEQ